MDKLGQPLTIKKFNNIKIISNSQVFKEIYIIVQRTI